MPRDYLTVADVLGMHAILMQRYGGAGGVRDPGALESALFRPQTGYYADIIAEAAALLESLAINHPFVDGNKRIAFAAADVFLRINGWCLKRPSMVIHKEMLQLFEAGTFDIAHLEPWLREFAITRVSSGSYPSRRPKSKNLRFQHLRRFVMLSGLARQNLSFEPAMLQFDMPRAPHSAGLCAPTS